jgi:hypothetical protein
MHVEAETSLTESLELLLERDAEMTPRSAAVMHNLGLAIAAQGRFEESEAILLESGVPRQSLSSDFPRPESSTGD